MVTYGLRILLTDVAMVRPSIRRKSGQLDWGGYPYTWRDNRFPRASIHVRHEHSRIRVLVFCPD